MRIQIVVTVEVDKEEYYTPADGNVKADLKDQVKDFLEGIPGVEVEDVKAR